MIDKPVLLFDAGGTLVFPDYERLSLIAAQAGQPVRPEVLSAAHGQLFFGLDEATRLSGRLVEVHDYFKQVFLQAGLAAEKAGRAEQLALEENQVRGLWGFSYPWVTETLAALAGRGYRLAVISNADGRAEAFLEQQGQRKYLEHVFDSHLLGVAKPDQRIFEIALSEMGLQPEQAIYIGDLYYVDVWGANRAGMGAVHLDRYHSYGRYPGVHLTNVGVLPRWLEQYRQAPQDFDLHPAAEVKIESA